MIFYFTLEGDSLLLSDYKTDAKTGNVNSYTCKFQLDDAWLGLKVFSSFKSGDKVYTMALSDDFTCTIPHELLTEEGEILVGLYATNFGGEDFKRISSNWVNITVTDGAYDENLTAPAIPTPDFWEELAKKMTPKIGENGNWFLWSVEDGEYYDTGVSTQSEIDHDFSEISKKPLANDVISKRFKNVEENHYKKEDSDYRYLIKDSITSTSNHINEIEDYIPNSPVLDCRITGDYYQKGNPTITQIEDVQFTGDHVTDSDSEHFGKYLIPFSFFDKEYNLYINEPLRALLYYGSNTSNYTDYYVSTSDYIDFKNKRIVRNVREMVIDDISLIKEQDNICYKKGNKLWVMTVLNVPDMTTSHPSGRWVLGDVLSNRLQTYLQSSTSIPVTDNYIMTKNGYNDMYFYWDLSLLGFSYELSDESDYLLKTTSNDYYKVKDENSNYLTDFSQIRERIKELYKDEPVKIYYPLSSPKIEPLKLPSLFMPESGPVDFFVDTETHPREINICYFADISKKFTELKQRVDNLESAILSLGADIG